MFKTGIVSSDEARHRNVREAEVISINAQAYTKINRAHARDNYFLRNLQMNPEINTPLTPNELDEINEFWQPYSFAYKNNPEVQRVFSRISGRFDPSYIGFGLWISDYFNRVKVPLFTKKQNLTKMKLGHILDDKILCGWFFCNTKQPKTFLYSAWGAFLDENRCKISKNQAIQIAYSTAKKSPDGIIVKESIGDSGNAIVFIEPSMTKGEITEIINRDGNFVYQEVIKCHPSFTPYSPSVAGGANTLKIATMVYKDKLHWIGSALRMRVDSKVDNFGQGGLGVSVSEDGKLDEFAVDIKGNRQYSAPNGLRFHEHKLHNYENAHRMVLEMHKMVPFRKYVGWDLTINELGEPVFIEANTALTTELFQSLGIHPFLNRKFAKEIYDECLVTCFYYDKANFDWNYREFASHISLAKYCGIDEIVDVPEYIDGKKVRFLYANALSEVHLNKTRIPKSIKIM